MTTAMATGIFAPTMTGPTVVDETLQARTATTR